MHLHILSAVRQFCIYGVIKLFESIYIRISIKITCKSGILEVLFKYHLVLKIIITVKLNRIYPSNNITVLYLTVMWII